MLLVRFLSLVRSAKSHRGWTLDVRAKHAGVSQIGGNEDPHLVPLDKVDIWVQIYDLPVGMVSERIIQSIGTAVGTFIKVDPNNLKGLWKPFVRVRVTLDIKKPLKRRMKLKREGAIGLGSISSTNGLVCFVLCVDF